MKFIDYFDSSFCLSESFEITPETESSLLNQLLDSLRNKATKDNIEEILVNILYSLKDKGVLKLKFVNRNSSSKESFNTRVYGFYSPFDNVIYLCLDDSNFDTKWFGMVSDYSKIIEKDYDRLLLTLLHELIHYTCVNRYLTFIKIWNDIFKKFLWAVFDNIAKYYFGDFVEIETFKNMTSSSFINSIDFKKSFDTYYNSQLINIRFRYKSHIKLYNDVLSTLYSKQKFEYARFFDNVLINALKLQREEFSNTPLEVFKCIRKAYTDIEPLMMDVKINSLHYQELFNFSEISCIMANNYRHSPLFTKLILNTLKSI